MNTAEYLAAFESFVSKLQQLPSADLKQISEAMTELCTVLRLGKVEAIIFENEAAEHMGNFTATCFYDCGEARKRSTISQRVSSIDEKITFYNVYAIKENAAWTEEEQRRINIFIAILSTFIEKIRLAELTDHMTFHESDFDMYNLKHFMKTAQMLCRSGRIDQFTVVRFNLKHFSAVNQYVGRKIGSFVMKQFIDLIDDLLTEENELICRIGGDNFLTLVKSDKLHHVVNILCGTEIDCAEINESIFISATMGVYIIRNIESTIIPTDIMDRVSIAAQVAKNSPNTDIVYFDNSLFSRFKSSNEISANFPKALEEREFLVYYQPKVAIDGRHIAGAEALCRWLHNGRLISPGEFIPILEQGRDICELDFYMLDAVCRDIRKWMDSGMNVVRISVNLSRIHLSQKNLLEHIIEIVDRHNVPHKYIEIELTETTTDVEFKDLKKIIAGLQRSGFSTSVDDFGIGYSSLNLIKELPWNVLKLDKSLLPAEGDENPVQKSIMFKYIVAMAQEMGLECISEGVETKEQIQLLAENKCNLVQGYYFDKPLPLEEFETRLDINYVYDR